jgi:fatty-acyl-CoA synthase
MTETSPLGSLARVKPALLDRSQDEQFEFRAQAGVPVPFMDVRVLDDEGNVAPWDGKTTGELQVRGPWVARSYYNLPQSGDKFTSDGWFCTGDVANISPEGYIHITDRTKDLIKSGGEWISSVELENEIMAHSAVAEAGVIAVRHPKWSERPLAVVVKKEGQNVTEDELRKHLDGKFAKFWMPDAFVFADELPHTATGKVRKTELRESYGDHQWT